LKRRLAVFAGLFALYLFSAPPALAPYRDSGEMASSCLTLGVSHPTSYPLYVLLGHLAQAVPVGSPAYRLSVLSAAAAAAAAVALGAVAQAEWGAAAGLSAALLLGLNETFWSVAIVQEMYTLWILAAVLLAGLALRLRKGYRERLWLGFAFCYGLALGNRLDLLLWAPGLVWLALSEREAAKTSAWSGLALLVFPAVILAFDSNAPIALLIAATALWRGPAAGRPRWAARSCAFVLAGLSVYLYLPVRSAGGPWLDWNHPAAFGNLVDSILRTRYGGTLDLLSKSYAKGELFGANMALYGRHLWSCFRPLGLAAVAAGFALSARREPRRWLGQLAAYWWSGPVFLLLANMPPNPHAAAIVEPHYLLSDAMLVLWAAEGAGWAFSAAGGLAPAAALLVFGALPFSGGLWARARRRDQTLSEDFARAAFSAVRPGGVIVAKKDVPLYTLWYYQLAHGARPDARVVAQGLAGAAWYQADLRRRGFAVTELRDARGWDALKAASPDFAATPDAEIPGELAGAVRPRGLLTAWDASPAESAALWTVSARRGDYRYEAQPDFFASDVIDEFAQAALRSGLHEAAWAMHWLFPEPAALLGYAAFMKGDLDAAQADYGWAAELSDRLSALAADYRALAPVQDAIRRQAAENRVQLGVALERLGRRDDAQKAYRAALERFPLAQAHYDLAVLAWNRDWPAAEQELELAVALDPSNQQARHYLAALRARKR